VVRARAVGKRGSSAKWLAVAQTVCFYASAITSKPFNGTNLRYKSLRSTPPVSMIEKALFDPHFEPKMNTWLQLDMFTRSSNIAGC
jgi:hypothetical protein